MFLIRVRSGMTHTQYLVEAKDFSEAYLSFVNKFPYTGTVESIEYLYPGFVELTDEKIK